MKVFWGVFGFTSCRAPLRALANSEDGSESSESDALVCGYEASDVDSQETLVLGGHRFM